MLLRVRFIAENTNDLVLSGLRCIVSSVDIIFLSEFLEILFSRSSVLTLYLLLGCSITTHDITGRRLLSAVFLDLEKLGCMLGVVLAFQKVEASIMITAAFL